MAVTTVTQTNTYRVFDDFVARALLLTLTIFFGGWMIASIIADGYHFTGWWLIGWILLAALIIVAIIFRLDEDRSGTGFARAAAVVAFVMAVLSVFWPQVSSALDIDGTETNPAVVIAQLSEDACPDGVADSTNWPEQSDSDFALAAGPSLLGSSPSEVLDAWYGDEGRGCTQLAKELQALVALRPNDVGLEPGDDFVNQLRPRWLENLEPWEQSVDQTAPVFANLLANDYREEVQFRDNDAWCITVTNEHEVVQVESVFVNPVSGYEGLPSLPESVEEGAHVWYLPSYDIFCQEAPFERVPVQEGEVELGQEAEEERVATDDDVAETAAPEEEAKAPSDQPAGQPEDTDDPAPQPGADQDEDKPGDGGQTGDTTGPGDDEDEGTTGQPGDGGECEGAPGCDGEEPGGGGGGGDDDGDCPGCPGEGDGGGDDGDDDCRNCPPDTTQPPDDGCPCPPPTSPTTTVPQTTTTTRATTTTTRATTTTTQPTTTTTTRATTTTTQPTTTTTEDDKGSAPCNPLEDRNCNLSASAEGPSTSMVLFGLDTGIPPDTATGLLAAVLITATPVGLWILSARRKEEDGQEWSS
jgi:hypothetical protein